ncbi:MAG: radical SAM protein [Bacilli bacterium]|nr:radical SAM protein [Bacilli bacterium]
MKKPTILYIRVSENCNSHCFMCHYAGRKDSYNISMEQYEELLEYAKKEKIKTIRFTGGEPLIHQNILEFIKKANNYHFQTSIITNGFLLKKMARQLIESGLTQYIISIDGSCPQIHDNLRNFKGCFKNAIEGIKLLRENNPQIKIRVNTVVSGRNIKDLPNIYSLLNKLGVNQWSIIPIKSKESTWLEDSKNDYQVFLSFLNKNKNNNLEFLGYSRFFAGKTEEEIDDTFNNNLRLKNKSCCHVVDYVRFYIPDTDRLVPCNCIAHRLDKIPVDLKGDREVVCERLRKWLKNHSQECTGCEPLNTFINDYPEIMEKEIMNY